MVKKAAGKTKHPVEILDDNGTLIATARNVSAATGRAVDEGKAPANKRGLSKP